MATLWGSHVCIHIQGGFVSTILCHEMSTFENDLDKTILTDLSPLGNNGTITPLNMDFSWTTGVTLIDPTSLSDVKKDQELQLYPNPTRDFFTIRLNQKCENLELVITDLTGRKQFSKKIANEKGTNVDVRSLAAGHYVVTLISPTTKSSGKLMVK